MQVVGPKVDMDEHQLPRRTRPAGFDQILPCCQLMSACVCNTCHESELQVWLILDLVTLQ